MHALFMHMDIAPSLQAGQFEQPLELPPELELPPPELDVPAMHVPLLHVPFMDAVQSVHVPPFSPHALSTLI
jgi:hypothetical protein